MVHAVIRYDDLLIATQQRKTVDTGTCYLINAARQHNSGGKSGTRKNDDNDNGDDDDDENAFYFYSLEIRDNGLIGILALVRADGEIFAKVLGSATHGYDLQWGNRNDRRGSTCTSYYTIFFYFL